MESRADQVRAFALALLLHAGAIALVWLSARWIWPVSDASAAGEPIQATLMVSAADIRRAQKAIKASPMAAAVKAPQPLPSKHPQTSDTPLQAKAQAPQDHPDTVDQAAVSRTAPATPDPALQEQKERIRQAQVDLTEDIARQREAESRQRLREQLDANRREQAAAAKHTKMEEQRLAQMEDLRTAPKPAPAAPVPAVPFGNRGDDDSLLARYKAAMQQAADANWNRTGAPERVRCKVRFTQIPGGEVIDVEFVDCSFDAQGRDSVDRALRRNPMPYSGYERVFDRKPTITFCYPQEDCHP